MSPLLDKSGLSAEIVGEDEEVVQVNIAVSTGRRSVRLSGGTAMVVPTRRRDDVGRPRRSGWRLTTQAPMTSISAAFLCVGAYRLQRHSVEGFGGLGIQAAVDLGNGFGSADKERRVEGASGQVGPRQIGVALVLVVETQVGICGKGGLPGQARGYDRYVDLAPRSGMSRSGRSGFRGRSGVPRSYRGRSAPRVLLLPH